MLNKQFKNDKSLCNIIPLDKTNPLSLFQVIILKIMLPKENQRWKILAKLLNTVENNLIDERAINIEAMDMVLSKDAPEDEDLEDEKFLLFYEL